MSSKPQLDPDADNDALRALSLKKFYCQRLIVNIKADCPEFVEGFQGSFKLWRESKLKDLGNELISIYKFTSSSCIEWSEMSESAQLNCYDIDKKDEKQSFWIGRIQEII